MRSRARQAAGFSLMEIMIVIFIIGLLVGITLVGLGEWRDHAREGATIARLEALEAVLDEYHEQLGRYPFLPPPAANPGPATMNEFLIDAQRVGKIGDLLGGLRGAVGSEGGQGKGGEDPDDVSELVDIVDGWNKPIEYVGNAPGRTDANDRPFFYSYGPDGIDDNGTNDDLRSNALVR